MNTTATVPASIPPNLGMTSDQKLILIGAAMGTASYLLTDSVPLSVGVAVVGPVLLLFMALGGKL